ncbi:helix-turn-helix domain-containing protein, partial [Inhella proteolytica]
GAQPAAALARRRLHEAGSLGGLRGRGQATRADPLGLTARERRLLQELAGGDSYRAIAARWHRSPRTVENHARHLLAKLGLRSRTELPALLAADAAKPA